MKLGKKSIELTIGLIRRMENVDGASISMEVGVRLADTI